MSLRLRVGGGAAMTDDPLRLRDWLAYWRWRFRCWTVLPGDRFVDFMRQVDYRVVEVRHEYVVAVARTNEARALGYPGRRTRVARPLPMSWWAP